MFECKTCTVLKEQLEHERKRNDECPTCESLRSQLERVQAENQRLLNHIINPPKPEEPPEVKLPEPIPPRSIPWNIKKQMLEQESRKAAKIQEDHDKETEKLEKEINELNQKREAEVKNG